jgi:uncharacterized protein
MARVSDVPARRFLVLIIVCMLTGCTTFAPRPDRTRLLLLTPITPLTSASGTAAEPTPVIIGLGPVNLPQYLDRLSLVTRTSPNGIELSNNEQWAEPLSDNFRHVLAADLIALLPNVSTVQFPWYQGTKLDYIVRVSVERFDTNTAGTAELIGRWELRSTNGELLASQGVHFSQQATASTGDAAAAALSSDLGNLARQIGSAVEQEEQQHLAQRQG